MIEDGSILSDTREATFSSRLYIFLVLVSQVISQWVDRDAYGSATLINRDSVISRLGFNFYFIFLFDRLEKKKKNYRRAPLLHISIELYQVRRILA